MPTVGELLREAKALLAAAPFDPSPREAHILLGRILGLDEARLLSRDREPVPAEAEAALRGLLERRLAGEPVAYLLGEREFYGRSFLVDPRVLVPRPETEHLVETALELELPDDARVLDVGVGSGAIAVTLALERPGWRVLGTDLDPGALAVARTNAGRLGAPVAFAAADLASAVDLSALDLLVSNPPYVAPADAPHLSPEVRDFEPHRALFPPAGEAPRGHRGSALRRRRCGGEGSGESAAKGGETPVSGVAVVARLLEQARALRSGTAVLVEVGAGQMDAVGRLAAAGPLRLERAVPDYAGIDRVALLRHL